jgi:hypothetical protein
MARAKTRGPDTLQQIAWDHWHQIRLQTGGGPYIRQAHRRVAGRCLRLYGRRETSRL